MNSALSDAFDHCRTLITKGSKSFSLAAKLFPPEIRDAAFGLYGWCRTCDDEIDGSRLGFMVNPTVNSLQEKQKSWESLVEKTRDSYAGKQMADPVYIAFQHVVLKYKIPIEYPLDLLEGMAMDMRNERYETLEDLKLYCYRVAGTVGLMMSHIMGLSSEKALQNARDMGIAMQLTNISRDVKEDFKMGRVYIPLSLLRSNEIPVENILDMKTRPQLVFLIKQILGEAEKLYKSGDRGLSSLSFRAAISVAAARQIYSDIGHQLIKRGDKAWDERMIISSPRKIELFIGGALNLFLQAPIRILKPWKPVALTQTCRGI